jgi:outer membrane PBP1 activator LpoA protein
MPLIRISPALCLSIALGMLALGGCTTGVRPEAPVLDNRLQEQVTTLEQAGNHRAAAELYLQQAGEARSPRREDLLLLGAASLIRAGDTARAALLLDELSAATLTDGQQQRYALSRARLALLKQQPDPALALLADVPADGEHALEYRQLRAEALDQKQAFYEAARERVALDPLLAGEPVAQLENQFGIWQALSSLTDAQLQQLRTAPPPDTLSGWMELLELTRLYLQQPDALAEVIPHWQMRYIGHPAGGAFIEQLLDNMRAAGKPPRQVAVLLPLSGNLGGPAAAVRDGILASYYDSPDHLRSSHLRFYDIGADPLAIQDTYNRAVQDGAEFIIGPLRKEAVQVLVQQQDIPVPVLALNHVDQADQVNPSVFQFGLAPEDEAREVAERAWQEGHSRALVLVPEGSWSERVTAAFIQRWTELGGQLLEQQRYKATEADHGPAISSLLNLDSSKLRKTRLVRLLGSGLEFEPRRRQDVDFIFLLATPEQARLIRPQLKFYRASSVPVLSTSHVYSGHVDSERDIDLNGLQFCDMPWLLDTGDSWHHLKQAVGERWPEQSARYARLHALGIDAWRITPYLGQPGGGMFGSYHGVTGTLHVDTGQQVHRRLQWARFTRGEPQLLVAPPVPATPTPETLPPAP